ncbi:hypothetical protein AADZ86_05850 [Colwelliaceae bacterium BS250]
MIKIKPIALILTAIFSSSVLANNCIDSKDSFDDYDDTVKQASVRDLPTEYYVLSYSWAPRHCEKASDADKRPGGEDYLQCNSGRNFGYILHGLWPQGRIDNPHKYPTGYPRACEGEQPKIAKSVLQKYLCMTPSVSLLQHEYEYHGTCMHDESLETPQAYFDTALRLHQSNTFPEQQIFASDKSVEWLVKHNPHLTADAILYDNYSQEWRICYDSNFAVMSCPLK